MPRVRKAVITAAGRGSRQYPASSAVQKEMFPLVDRDGLAKPVIQIIGEEAIEAGIEEICIITQPGEDEMVRDYLRGPDDNYLKRLEKYPALLREAEQMTVIEIPENEESNHGELEHNQPQPTREEKTRELRLWFSSRQLEVSTRAGEKNEYRRAEMRDPARKEKHWISSRDIRRIEKEGVVMHEIARVIDKHDYHH